MDELLRPEEISLEDWGATPVGVQTFILTLVPLREQVALLEARLNQHSQNSSKPPSTDPPSALTGVCITEPRQRPALSLGTRLASRQAKNHTRQGTAARDG